jgi:hypothetical protein
MEPQRELEDVRPALADVIAVPIHKTRGVSLIAHTKMEKMLTHLDATVNAVTAAVRARSSFPNNTDGFTLSPDATDTALFPSSEAYGGDANLQRVPTSESTTSVSLWTKHEKRTSV